MQKLIFNLCCFLSILLSQKAFAQNEFITEWLTTDGTITIPTSAGQTMPGETAPYIYNYNIVWYNKSTGAQLGFATNRTGDYTINNLPTDTIEVKITGTFPHFYSNYQAWNLIHVKQWGNIQWKSFYRSFAYSDALETIPTQAPNLTQVKDISYMFAGLRSFNQDLSTWDVSNVTNMSSMFLENTSFNGDLSSWNVSNVTNMAAMFYGASAFNADLSAWNVSNVTSMSSMFKEAYAFNADLSTWNVSNVTSMSSMFKEAYAFNADLSAWNVSNVTDMSEMFYEARAFNADLSAWNVSNVTSMYRMFYEARAFNADLSAWDISKVVVISNIFYNTNISYCNMDYILNAWAPILLSKSYSLGEVPNASINSSTLRNALEYRIYLQNPEVTNPTFPILSISVSPIICKDSSVTILASGADIYKWNGVVGTSTNTFTVTTDTLIILKAIAANDCFATDTLDIKPVTVTITSNALNNAACLNTSVRLTASGANTYEWNNISGTSINTFTLTADTTFIVKGTAANGCIASDTLSITTLALPTIIATSNALNNAACLNTSVSLSASGANTYEWNNTLGTSTNTFTLTADTTFVVKGIDGNGCENTTSLQITALALPTVIVTSDTTTICSGSAINLLAFGANTYEWSTQDTQAEITVAPTHTTTYTVIGIDTNGCENTASLQIRTLPLPNVIASTNTANDAACLNTPITLIGAGAISYFWNNRLGLSTNTFTVTADTTIILKGIDGNGCENTASLQITALALPIVNLTSNAINNEVCFNNAITLTATGADTYEWNNIAGSATNTFTITADTTMRVKGIDANGCIAFDTLSISMLNLPNINITSDANDICSGTQINIEANGANTYEWNTQETESEITVIPTQTTTYSVVGRDTNGCENNAAIVITIRDLPTVTLTTDTTTICLGNTVNLVAAGAVSFEFEVSPIETTTYTVTATALNGCQNTAELEIIVEDCVGVDKVNFSYSVYPNPTMDYVIVKTENIDYSNATIVLLDITGRVLHVENLIQENTAIALANYPAGLYFIRIQAGEAFFVEKVSKI